MRNFTLSEQRRAFNTRVGDVAVIGMACRFPGANNYQEYWENLVEGRVSIGEIPPERWRWQDYWGDPQSGDNRCNSKWGGFIDDVDAFDMGFFGMSAREVESMDPQQRLGLELAWSCFEDAGLRPSGLSGRSVGVFVGVANLDYKEITEAASASIDAYYATGIAASVLSNRISYYFNFHGPSVPIDTACSSALYAIHAACQAIRENECEAALAGGISLLLTPRRFICFARSKMLSPSGAIRAFDADADGMVRGEGGGFILLKPLARALAEGDRIVGVIRGSAVNHSGRTYSLTYPSATAQAEVISRAQQRAGVAPSDITYIEAHGTGTPKGDPIELEGLVRAFHPAGVPPDAGEASGCGLGSAKPNIGHLEAAAGIAGVIKVLLSMQHQTLPPLANFRKLNPRISQDGSWFRIAERAEEWATRAGTDLVPLPRVAGVSAFGFAGTNAHVIVEEAPAADEREVSPPLPWNILCLSARTGAALARKQREMVTWLERHGGQYALSEICAGLLHGREHFAVRAAVVARTAAEMAESLQRGGTEVRDGIYYSGSVPFDEEGKAQYPPNESLRLADVSQLADREVAPYLETLAREYVKGMSPDDWGLYDRADRARAPLPTYPFEKTRCWVAQARVARATESLRSEGEAVPHRLMLFDESWSPRPLTDSLATGGKPSAIVCFVATPLHQQLMAATLSQLDPSLEVVFVNRGTPAGKRTKWEYGAQRGDSADFREVLDEIARDFGEVRAVWYCWELHSKPGSVVDEGCFDSVVSLIRALDGSSLRTHKLLLAAPAADGPARCFYEAWLGLERSLRARLSVVPIYLDTAAGMRACVSQLWREEVNDTRVAVRYLDGERRVASVEPIESADAADVAGVIRGGGSYLITGGMGGLGWLFARHLAAKYGAKVVVTGRSAPDGALAEKLADAARPAAGQIRYRQADVSDGAAMALLLEEVEREWGPLNGVIHAAGVEDHVSLLEKDSEQFRRVLAPKVRGALVLDELLADTPLDFVCYFSSLAAVLGDFGTGAYAVANRFLMSHAQYRRALEERGERYGKTLAVVWPLWREGVMGFESEQAADAYLRSSGQRRLETDEGLAVFESLLAQKHVHPIVIAGMPGIADAFIGARKPAEPSRPAALPRTPPGLADAAEAKTAAASATKTIASVFDSAAEAKLVADLKQIAGDVLRVSPEHLDSSSSFTDFGFESISLMEFAARLTEHFGLDVTPTVFFSHSTFTRLARHFVSTHYDAVGRLYLAADGFEAAAPVPVERLSEAPPTPSEARTACAATASEPMRAASELSVPVPIALVGMSGRFPKARDVEEMWSILENGLEAVEEIPASRFDWRTYFDESGQGRGKINTKWTGSIPGVDEFDPLFFEISPQEAERIDPRERLLLQEAWHALEDAGYGEKRLRASSIGMFVGAEGSDYASLSDEPGSIISNHNGILAARLSYFLDFKGPNIAINTACSSGLVAVHLACQSLRLGECDVAIAAGVNLMIVPELYVKLSEAAMLSPDGKCYAFDRRANGIVPGEAVVVVVLKPLDRALAENDPIYAVIRGSGINYDGKTNGITAPSGEAQTRLIESVYERHCIDPDKLGYVVAHGTGTKLGDPVEVNALNDALGRFTNRTGFCALTSSKTNFGHTFAASGLVSLVGLVQAMRHGRIPPSLHWEAGNEFVNWQTSPFFVNTAARAWPDDRHGQWGAVSAFGMSGTNAHVVVEGYEPPRRAAAETPRPPYSLLVLSAKTEEALRRKAEELSAFLARHEVSDADLTGICDTLLNGRLHFQRRCALVVAGVRQASDLLARCGRGTHADIFESRANEDQQPQTTTQEDYVRFLRAQAEEVRDEPARLRETLRALAGLYCRGADITDEPPARPAAARPLRLPGYPFAREHYWVTPLAAPAARASEGEHLHPLVHRNVSDFTGQAYAVRLTGEEFCLRDHVIEGQRILPGAAYLEMVRFAVEAATGGAHRVELRDVIWAEPLVVAETGREVEVKLKQGAGVVEYRVVSGSEGEADEQVHSYGTVLLREACEPARVDLERLRGECAEEVFDAEQLYRRFRQMGIDYGASHRGVVRVYAGREKILARLELPHVETAEGAACKLHPGMLDSAFQASLALTASRDRLTPALPFALEKLEFYKGCGRAMWALVQVGGRGKDGHVRQLDFDLINETGEVCVRLRGFVSRPATAPERDDAAATVSAVTSLRHPVWSAQPFDGRHVVQANDVEHHVLLLAPFAGLASALDGARGMSCEPLAHAPQGSPDEEFLAVAVALFRRVKERLGLKPSRPLLVQVVCASGVQSAAARGLLGLLRTAHVENPHFFGQLVETEPAASVTDLVEVLADAARQGDHVRYEKGQRLVPVWETLARHAGTERTAWRADGVYLISGGAGGIGLQLAREIMGRGGRAKVVLLGRAPLSPEREAELRALDADGERLRYAQVDVSNRTQVQTLVDALRASDGLHGVIHCAGINRDSFIINKDEDEFREVLKPKVAGVVSLDEATRDCALDFFVCFSSLAGAFGNAGQADYAAANAFLDAYVELRESLVAAGRRYGQSVSIQWPLWESGGMRVERPFVEQMAETKGLAPLDVASALAAFYAAVASGRRQVLVTHGDQSHIGHWLEQEAARRAARTGEPGEAVLTTPTLSLLREILAAIAGVRPEDTDADADVSEYGLDRHAIARLAEAVNERAGLSGARRLNAATVIEHGSLRRLADYLTVAGATPAVSATEVGAENGFREQAGEYVKRLLARAMKLPVSKLESKVALEKYGINSLMIVRLNSHFEEHFGALPKTLLFEYQTLEELTAYFIENHAETLKRLTGVREADPKLAGAKGASTAERRDASPSPSRFTAQAAAPRRQASDALEIAMIGLAGRYPQARNVEEFGRNLREGRDCITEVPRERWDHSRYFDPDKTKAGKTYSMWGGFIDGVDEFDPLFFQISPRDAELMDPQERLFLQCAFETLEDAGYTRASLAASASGDLPGNVGVFVGVMYEEYQLYGAQASALGHPLALAGNPSSIANRVSYHFNLHGPSMAVDTMCSSSLTAIHLACRSLQRGECEAALAGGVNVSIHPNKYLMLGQNKFVSSKGRCESFGEGGDGYVPSEGVGAVLLKPLARALADGDHIYGVINATAVNHGGKTNGYTVPNPNAQASVIRRALGEAGIYPRAVSYVEAHGTGTVLGDPVEITGLVKAFRAGAQAPAERASGYCAIGSVKSNIGHAESAAGIAGLTKVLLQMHDRVLFPSLHSETLNPNIDFDNTPFVVQQTLSEWKRPVLEVGGTPTEFPRIAGISSFGAGGSNAHVLVREYAEEATAPPRARPAVVVLSAKDDERLRERVEQLAALLKRNVHTDADLPALAYTLQVGREAMEERLAFTASTLAEVSDKLTLFLEQGREAEGLFCGQVKAHRQSLGGLESDEDAAELVDVWMRKGKQAKVLDLWAKGVSLDWARWYGEEAPLGERPHRLSLPPYPFARTRYWVNLPEGITRAGVPKGKLHPLLHANTSVLARQRFSTRFTGSEFFLKDHRVNGRALLPGAAYLEMARRAVELSVPELEGGSSLRLARVVWREPFVVGAEGATLHVELRPAQDDNLAFEIYSQDEEARATRRIHCEGVAIPVREVEPRARVELSAVQLACDLAAPTAQACYDAFSRMGIDYGPAHRSIEELWVGPEQVLAKLRLPRVAAEAEGGEQFLLHPSMLDGALQAAIALDGDPETARAELPFALNQLDILGPCSQVMWARVESVRSQANSHTLNVSLYDEAGDESVRLLGVVSRSVARRAESGDAEAPGSTDAPVGDLVLAPVWRPVTPERIDEPRRDSGQVFLSGATREQRALLERRFGARVVCDNHDGDDAAGLLKSSGSISHVIFVAPAAQAETAAAESLIEGQHEGVLRLFRLVKSLLSEGYGARELVWTVITEQTLSLVAGEESFPTHASVHGLAGVMAKEHARWAVRLVDLEREAPWPLEELFALPTDADADVWAHRRGQWYRRELLPVQASEGGESLYRRRGVYVVIGGAGGIGRVWSESLIRDFDARIIWLGRRPLDAEIQAGIDELAAHGQAPLYIQADATDGAALRSALDTIERRFGPVHGVVHSALVLRDQSLANMDEEIFRQALAAKVDISVRLVQVFGAGALDFILFFSSFVSFSRAAGQSNYAAGCTFKDAYARHLSGVLDCAVKVINWGYWGGTGVVASPTYRQRMAQLGIGSIEPRAALKTLDLLLEGPLDQLALVKVTRPGVVRQMSDADRLAVQPRREDVSLARLVEHLPSHDARIAELKAGGGLQGTEFDELLVPLLWGLLNSLGSFEGPASSPQELRERLCIFPLYARWFDESLAILVEQGRLVADGGKVRASEAAGRAELSALWRSWEAARARWAERPQQHTRLALLEATLRALPEILTGRVQATDVVFPGASMALVEGVYKHNAAADFFNQLVAQLAAARAAAHDDDARPLRILEVGAGTGGTSAPVLTALRPYEQRVGEYCYTDISKAFLTHAEKEYGREFPFLTYRLFDVTRPLTPQGIDEGGFDLVIATNVLHATPDIRQTLRNCQAALADRGIMLINEISDKSLFTHLTFGLLKGWWSFEDSRLRMRGSPALYPEVWRQVLAEEGFETTLLPVPEAYVLGQQVIAAQSNGVTRQPSTREPAPPPRAARTSAPAHPVASPVPAAHARADVRRHVQKTFVELLTGALKVEVGAVDADESFADYGLDSIVGVSVAQAVNEALGITLDTTSLFDYNTVNLLTEHILEQFGDALNASYASDIVAAPASRTVEAAQAREPSGQLRPRIEGTVVRLLSEALKVAPGVIDHDEPFADFGLDSIIGVGLAQQLNDALGIELDTTSLFDYSTVNSLTEHILLKFGELVQSLARPASESPSAAAPTRSDAGDVAIVGVSLHFPQSRDLEEFWGKIVSGASCISEAPPGRLTPADGASDAAARANWHGGFIENVEHFDPLFFNISPKEAQLMDPQQRLLLTHAWRAVEDAGISPKSLAQARTGVFVAAGANEHMGTVSIPGDSPFAMTATAPSLIPNRISYTLNLRGPSEYCDTACSSGLVALHRAVQSLRQGECEQAIVGAVNLLLSAAKFEGFAAMGFLSPRGEVKSFQTDADGFVRSEGVAALILKPLASAVADGSFIYGVIKGTGVEHGGKGVSLTAPNAAGIRASMMSAYRAAGLDPQSVSYIEAHGIGSPLGDAIELNALKAAYAELAAAAPADTEPPTCYIGSLKPTFGHGELVSGLMAVCKVLMAFRHRTIPGVPGCGPLNEHISLEGTPLRVAEEHRPWEAAHDTAGRALPRRAGINSFGFGGVNAHLLLEEYIEPEDASARAATRAGAARAELVVLSAKTLPQLREAGARLRAYVQRHPEAVLRDVAHTLQTGRKYFEWRAALAVETLEELEAGLRRLEALTEEESGQFFAVPLRVGRAAGRDVDEAAADGSSSVSALVEEASLLGRCEELAEYWVGGAEVPWHLLPGHAQAGKVPLPTYPFAEQRYRLDGATSPARPRAAAATEDELESRVEEKIRSLLAEELGLELHVFERHRPLREYGADSVLDLHLIRHLEQHFGVRLTVSELFESRTLEGVSRHVAVKVRGRQSGDMEPRAEQESAASSPPPDPVIELLERFRQGEVALDELLNLV
jgi:polyketide synthase PksN